MSSKTEALLLAQELPLNETAYSTCPACGGRKKFSVTRTREGVLWNCFRDSCSERGFSPVAGELLPPKRKQSRLKPLSQPLYPLEREDYEYFAERFHLSPNGEMGQVIQVALDGRYALHVRDWRRYTRGYVLRNGWSGLPECDRTLSDYDGPKTVLYMHARGPAMAWYPTENPTLVLVEDQISALRCQDAGLSACALLGTQLDNDKVREIAQWKPAQVVVALDADATATAFALARKWGLAFPKTRVAVLEGDLKDEEPGEIWHALGL